MNSMTLSFAGFRYRLFSHLANILTLALGLAIIIFVLLLGEAAGQRFERDLKGIDLVVGAKGSPIQLILSSVFHMDVPNGNIPLDEADRIAKYPLVKTAIPLALGDNYNGYRIVGTTHLYLDHYGATLASGRLDEAPMEIVVGADVASSEKVKVGDEIIGAHGLSNSDDLHKDFPYKVVGILNPTGSVLDRLLLTSVESVWKVHEHPDADEMEEAAHQDTAPGKEITALLLTYQSPMAAVVLPRLVNKSSAMEAASPAFETARLLKFIGVGRESLTVLAVMLMGVASLGFFLSLFHAVNERSYDLALMRSLGATRRHLYVLVVSEGLMLGLSGTALGLVFGHVFAAITLKLVTQDHVASLENPGFLPVEIYVILGAVVLSFIASLIPALKAYRINIVRIISRGT